MEQEDYFWTEEVISFSETGENKDRLGTIMHKFISMEAENVMKCGIFKPNFLCDVMIIFTEREEGWNHGGKSPLWATGEAADHGDSEDSREGLTALLKPEP